jgi:hypothetical protein
MHSNWQMLARHNCILPQNILAQGGIRLLVTGVLGAAAFVFGMFTTAGSDLPYTRIRSHRERHVRTT